ncbi:MAG: hypothetical protein KDC98_12200 [Planctomycetes bacterium]|nr:hypothetical protein [Planctomycetota bacterium]
MRHPSTFPAPKLALALALASGLSAQELRRGINDADVVVVARQIGKTRHDDRLDLHRLQIIHRVRGGAEETAVTVLDWPKLSVHLRPSPRQSRLYCLRDASGIATRLELPSDRGPYFKMVGWPGSNPLIGADVEHDPIVQFAAILARGVAGAAAVETAGELTALTVEGAPSVRTEATRLLAERGDLRASIAAPQWSRIVARASGETEDVPYKIALAQLCAEQRLTGLVDTLAVSLGPVQDPEYARAVGRIAKVLHGENATEVLERRLQHLRDPKDRAVVLRAIGATNTQAALTYLLRLDGLTGADAAVEAALREHRSPRAKEAVLRRQK